MVNWQATELPLGVQQNNNGRLVNEHGQLVYLVGGVCQNDYPLTKLGYAYFAGDSCIESCSSETPSDDFTFVTEIRAKLQAIQGAVNRAVVQGDRDIVIMCNYVWSDHRYLPVNDQNQGTSKEPQILVQEIINSINDTNVLKVHFKRIPREQNIIAERMARSAQVTYNGRF